MWCNDTGVCAHTITSPRLAFPHGFQKLSSLGHRLWCYHANPIQILVFNNKLIPGREKSATVLCKVPVTWQHHLHLILLYTLSRNKWQNSGMFVSLKGRKPGILAVLVGQLLCPSSTWPQLLGWMETHWFNLRFTFPAIFRKGMAINTGLICSC